MIPSNPLILAYAQDYCDSNMLSSVRIVRMAEPVLDQSNEGVVLPVLAKALYEGRARIYGLSGPQTSDAMDESQTFSTSYVSVPMRALDMRGDPLATQVDDMIEVTAHSDATVVGMVLRVLDVDAGGQWPACRRHMVTTARPSPSWVLV